MFQTMGHGIQEITQIMRCYETIRTSCTLMQIRIEVTHHFLRFAPNICFPQTIGQRKCISGQLIAQIMG